MLHLHYTTNKQQNFITMKKITGYLFSLWCVVPVSWDNLFENILNSMYPLQEVGSELSEIAVENLYTDLYSIYQKPLDVNTLTRQQLEQLPFLTQQNIEELLAYIYINHGMLSLGELQLVNSMDNNTVNLLYPFLVVGNSIDNEKTIIDNKASNEILLDLHYPFSSALRYKFSKGSVKLGIVTQRDRDEKIADFISPYFQWGNSGCVDNVVVGNYRISFGRGLLANQGFGIVKTMPGQVRQQNAGGIKPHSSTTEYDYLSGVAAVFRFGCQKLYVACSHTMIDATLNKQNCISSFKEDGYHRTALEKSKKHNVAQYYSVVHLQREHEGVNFGATASFLKFDHPMMGKVYKSSALALKGSLFNGSIDFLVNRPLYSLSGECAMSKIPGLKNSDDLSIASIVIFSLKTGDNSSIRIMPRYYSKNYYSKFAGGFAQNDINNEFGLYTGYNLQRKQLNINAYADLFSSKDILGADINLNGSLKTDAGVGSASIKARYKGGDKTLRLRMDWRWTAGDFFEYRTMFHVCHFFPDGNSLQSGFALQQNISYTASNFSLDLMASVFSTDSYYSRISMYQKGMLYSYNFYSYYGTGASLALLGNFKLDSLIKCLSLRIKIGSTCKLDNKPVYKADLQLQYKF